MRYEVQYVLGNERKTEIVEAGSYNAAEREAGLSLPGLEIISIRCLHLPEPGTVVRPKLGFIPEDELYEYERF